MYATLSAAIVALNSVQLGLESLIYMGLILLQIGITILFISPLIVEFWLIVKAIRTWRHFGGGGPIYIRNLDTLE
jgi:hypothetical protein